MENKIQEKLSKLKKECYADIISYIDANNVINDDELCIDLDRPVSVYYEDDYDQINKEYISSIRLNPDNNKIEYAFENDEWDYWRDDILDLGIEALFDLQNSLFNQFNK